MNVAMPGTLLDEIIADSACKDMARPKKELLQAMLKQPLSPDPLGINGAVD